MEKQWATVKLPIQVMSIIRKYSKRAKMEEWRFISQAVSSYVFFYTNPARFSKERTKLEKAVWYTIKLISTVEAFKTSPQQEFQQLLGIIQQIENGLNLDLSLLRKSVMDYYTNWRNSRSEMQKYAAAINAALKIAALEILESALTQ